MPVPGPHAPHVRTKKPKQGRLSAQGSGARILQRVGEIRHAVPVRAGRGISAAKARLLRRGPPLMTALSEASAPMDVAFKIGAAGVTVAAVVLGVALGLARPTLALGAAVLAVGALLAAVVIFQSRAIGRGASASSS